MRLLKLTSVTMIAMLLSCRPSIAGEIEIYIDGCPTVFEVPDDLEMYELETVYIVEDNRALLKEYCLSCPQEAVIGAGLQAWDRSLEDPSEFYGEREIQPYIRDIRYRDYLSSEEWNSAWGDLSYPGRMRLDLDHSGPRWSFDGSFMHHESVSAGPDGNLDDEVLLRGAKERNQFGFVLRTGGMDGGTHFLKSSWYKVSADEMPFQVVDVEQLRIGAGFRMVECPGMLQAEVFSGYYRSDRQEMDNTFSGASADGYLDLGERLTLFADSNVTEIRAKLQDGSSNRADSNAQLSYMLSGDLELSAGLQAYSDDSDISAMSDGRQYSERALSLGYHPSGRADVRLSVSNREVNYQRAMLEDQGLHTLYEMNQQPTRAELAGFRVAEEADYDSIRLRSNFQIDACTKLSADFRLDDYGTLPGSGDADSFSIQPSYLANKRQWSSLFLSRRYADGGRLELNASENLRDNDARDSHYASRRYALAYGRDINDCSRWTVRIGLSETDLSGNGIDVPWDSRTKEYGLDLSGYGNWTDYRISLGHHSRDGYSSGDYSSVGLELDLIDSPLVLNSWWREQDAGTLATGYSDDIGLSLGWRVRF